MGEVATGLLLASFPGAVGCSRNTPPAMPPDTSPKASQTAPSVPDAVRNLSGLRFDPRGADFTLWINTFKNEVYRNWVAPQEALSGVRGHVCIEFTVGRDGSISSLKVLISSGTASLDRAAQNALSRSHFRPLPGDYSPPRLTIQVTLYYNESPRERP